MAANATGPAVEKAQWKQMHLMTQIHTPTPPSPTHTHNPSGNHTEIHHKSRASWELLYYLCVCVYLFVFVFSSRLQPSSFCPLVFETRQRMMSNSVGSRVIRQHFAASASQRPTVASCQQATKWSSSSKILVCSFSRLKIRIHVRVSNVAIQCFTSYQSPAIVSNRQLLYAA